MAIDIKSIFADKLLDMLRERKLRDITVKDLLQSTGASKQTFYNHFCDKNDLICWIYENRILNSFQEKNLSKSYYLSCLDYTERLAANRRFMKQALEISGQNCLADYMKERSIQYDQEWQKYHSGIETLTDDMKFALTYHSCGNMDMIIRWIREGTKESPEFMARNITMVRKIGLSPVFGETIEDSGYDGI